MDVDQLQSLIEKSVANTGKSIANLPNVQNDARQQLFGSDPTLDSLKSNETSKIQELYEHDKQLAAKYAPTAQNPAGGRTNPFDPSMIMNPYGDEMYKASADQATQKQLGDIQDAGQKRRDVLGNALDKIMKIFTAHIDSEKYMSDTYQKELETKLATKKDNVSNLLSILSLTGGQLPPDIAKELGLPPGTRIPGEIERSLATKRGETAADKRSQSATDDALTALQDEIQTGLKQNSAADRKAIAWKWIHLNEPYFKSQGVNSASLWDAYAKMTSPQPAPQQQKSSGFLQNLLNGMGGGAAFPKG